MKIIFNIKSLHSPAGTEKATITIANELSKRGHEIHIVALEKIEEPYYEVQPSVKLQYLHLGKDKRSGLVRDFFRRIQLRAIFKKEQPDVIVFVSSARSLLYIPVSFGFKTITWEHFNVFVNWHLFHPLSKYLAAKFCNRIITLTNADKLAYEKKFKVDNVVTISNSIDNELIKKSPLTEKRALAIGRLTKQKGFDMLLEAWALTENRNKGWKLTIVGSGKMEQVLRSLINKHNLETSVELLPPTSDVQKHYQNSSLYVMSSRYEGLPLVLLEATAAGLPIVSFDCVTGPKDIIEDGISGKLVDPNNIELLAKEMDRLMDDKDLREYYSKNAIVNSKRFSTSNVVDEWEKLLYSIMNEK